MGCRSVSTTSMLITPLMISKLALSPWVALEYCFDLKDTEDVWACLSPESCGCHWTGALGPLVLQPRGCKEMGDDARVGLFAPSTLAPYVSLPTKYGGLTGYISTTTRNGTVTWISTVITGCTVPECPQAKP
jgi:hypothetical protein